MSKYKKSNTSKKWSTEEIIKFLEVYEEHPCLWNYNIPSYKDRNQRDIALREIVEVMSDTVRDFHFNAAKAKIRSIRNAYTLEHHKVLASYKSITSTGTIYKPTVRWYYVADRFLNGIVETRNTKNILEYQENCEEKQNTEGDQSHSQEELQEEKTAVDTPFAQPYSPSTSIINSKKRPAKKRFIRTKNEHSLKRKSFSSADSLTAAVNTLQNIVQKVDNFQETIDEFEIFGKTVAANLRQLPLNAALESQSEILNYLVQRRLGHRTALSNAIVPEQHFRFISSPHSSSSTSTFCSSFPEDMS